MGRVLVLVHKYEVPSPDLIAYGKAGMGVPMSPVLEMWRQASH